MAGKPAKKNVVSSAAAGSKKSVNELGVDPRDLTVEQRRALFTKKKKEMSKDWRVLKTGAQESLVPFNRLSLDHGLKLFGMAGMGTVYQFHGDEGSGKSTIAASIVKNYMDVTGEPSGYFDFERRLKSWYLRAMGCNEDMMVVDRPDSWEVSVQKAIDLMHQGVRLFVFDSIPRMRSKVDYEAIKSGAAFNVQPGTHARAIQQFYDLILPYIAGVDGTLIMINQTRSRIEMSQEAQMAAKGYHTVTNLNYSLPGGRANRYAISVMVENKLIRAYKEGKSPNDDPFILEAEAQNGEEYLALEIRHRTLKNTISGTGYRQALSYIRPGRGLDENMSLRAYAREFKLIANHGSKYYVGESYDNPIKVYDNKDRAIRDLVLDENPEVLGPLRELVVAQFTSTKAEDRAKVDAATKIEVSENDARYLSGEEEDRDDELNPKGFEVDTVEEVSVK
jgi:RecA/RadA recombinase